MLKIVGGAREEVSFPIISFFLFILYDKGFFFALFCRPQNSLFLLFFLHIFYHRRICFF